MAAAMIRVPFRRLNGVVLGALLLSLGPHGGSLAQEVEPLRLDPAVARCILDRLYGVESPVVAQLIYEACRAVLHQNGTGGGLMVHCRVPGDPSWVETRLLTPEQCARAGGVADR
jgi:hypothetical protein